MSERILLGGSDGWRGPATLEPGPGRINPETFALLTYTLVERQLERGQTGPVLIGRDTRRSGELLQRAALAGASLHDVEVWDLGIGPTPYIQRSGQEFNASAVVSVSASHNHEGDNGWKGMPGYEKPCKEAITDLSNRYWEHSDSGFIIPVQYAANAIDKRNLSTWYAYGVIESIEKEFGETPLRNKLFVVDGAYGAARELTPRVFRRLGANVVEFCCDNSGKINDGCGAAHMEGLKDFLATSDITSEPNFIGALANDGDADRMMALGVVHKGSESKIVDVTGNHIMGVHALGEPGIIGTEYTNSGLTEKLRHFGIGFESCDNGDTFVTQALRKKQADGYDWRRGGECTGHNIDTDWLPSGDGVRMAAWLAAYAVRENMTFGDIHHATPLWPERMASVHFSSEEERDAVMHNNEVQEALSRVRTELYTSGRVILRPSGTEKVVRIWVEGTHPEHIGRLNRHLARIVARQPGAL